MIDIAIVVPVLVNPPDRRREVVKVEEHALRARVLTLELLAAAQRPAVEGALDVRI